MLEIVIKFLQCPIYLYYCFLHKYRYLCLQLMFVSLAVFEMFLSFIFIFHCWFKWGIKFNFPVMNIIKIQFMGLHNFLISFVIYFNLNFHFIILLEYFKFNYQFMK
jgi:hypothetical protein